jgi:hypothetical protein
VTPIPTAHESGTTKVLQNSMKNTLVTERDQLKKLVFPPGWTLDAPDGQQITFAQITAYLPWLPGAT